MYKQITFGDKLLGRITAKKIEVITNPGVGTLRLSEIDGSIWTGDVHLYPSKESIIDIQISSINSVETRSSLNEDMESWEILFVRERCGTVSFSYEMEKNLENLLKKLQ